MALKVSGAVEPLQLATAVIDPCTVTVVPDDVMAPLRAYLALAPANVPLLVPLKVPGTLTPLG